MLTPPQPPGSPWLTPFSAHLAARLHTASLPSRFPTSRQRLSLSNTDQLISHYLPTPGFPRGCSQRGPGTRQVSLNPEPYLRAFPLAHVRNDVYLLLGDHEVLLDGRSHLLRGACEMQGRSKTEAVEN